MQAKAGMRYAKPVAGDTVLMEAVDVRCGDVWNCAPVPTEDPEVANGFYFQDYGEAEVLTDADLVLQHANYNRDFPKRPTSSTCMTPSNT